MQAIDRRKYITGTDAGVICGASPWKSPVQLWQEKLGLLEPEDISSKPVVMAGIHLEVGVVSYFEAVTKLKTEKPDGYAVHPDFPFIAGSIDRWIEGREAILECKTAHKTDAWGDDDNRFPEHYLLQIAHYCMLHNINKCYLAVFFLNTYEFKVYTYDRDMRLESLLLDKELAFWDMVQSKTAPEPANHEDIRALYPASSNAPPVVATQRIYTTVQEMQSINDNIDGLEARLKRYKDEISLFMGNSEKLIGPCGKTLATHKYTKAVNRLDTELLKRSNPTAYNSCLKEGAPSRRFVLTKGD
jgi:putative phage-type endonuclease